MANKSKFAPPTKEELQSFQSSEPSEQSTSPSESKGFAPPSAEELQAFNSPRTPASEPAPQGYDYKQDLVDLARGIGQGATFMGEDELYGLGKAGVEKLRGLVNSRQTEDFQKLYRQFQQEEETKNKAAKERSPYLYGGGELGGALGSGVLTAGSGLLAGGAAEGGMTAARLAQLATEGGIIGAGSGALGSEQNLDTLEGAKKLATDAAVGSATGAVLAPLAGAIGNKISSTAGSKAEGILAEHPELRKIATAYERGTEGKSLLGDEARKEIREGLSNKVSNAADALLAGRRTASEEIGGLVNEIGEVPSEQIFNNARQRMSSLVSDEAVPTLKGDADYQRYKQLINKYQPKQSGEPALEGFQSTSLVPESAAQADSGIDLQKLALDLKNLKKTTKDPSVKDLISGTIGDVENVFGQYGDIRGLNQQMKDVSSLAPELFTKKMLSQYPSEQKALEAIQKNLQSDVIKATRSGSTEAGEASYQKMGQLKDNLHMIEEKYPGMLEKMGISNPDEFVQGLIKQGETADIYRGVNTQNPHSSGFKFASSDILKPQTYLGAGATTGRGKSYLAANRIGQAVNKAHNVYEFTSDGLTKLADVLKSTGMENLGNALEKGIQDPSGAAKNAALFTIMQNPKGREAIRSLTGEQEEAK